MALQQMNKHSKYRYYWEYKYSMIHRPGKMYSKFEFEKNFPNSMWNISQNLS